MAAIVPGGCGVVLYRVCVALAYVNAFFPFDFVLVLVLILVYGLSFIFSRSKVCATS